MNAREVLEILKGLGSEYNRQGMARFGINTARAYGVGITAMRPLARTIKRDHGLALELWQTQVHEARILACMLADPAQIGLEPLDRWAAEADSWDLTDQLCNKLAVRTPFAWELAPRWAARTEEFVRRAGFSLMAQLAVHDKRGGDEAFLPFLTLVEQFGEDERNFVKKAVNWALRQIGKRDAALRLQAVSTARRLLERDSKAARWIARDALRELEASKP